MLRQLSQSLRILGNLNQQLAVQRYVQILVKPLFGMILLCFPTTRESYEPHGYSMGPEETLLSSLYQHSIFYNRDCTTTTFLFEKP